VTPRYREAPWSLTAVKVPSGARVWYYYWYDESGKRKGPKSTGIGYKKDRDRARTRKEAADYCATLFGSGRLGAAAPEGMTLDAFIDDQRFFDWHRSKWVRGILARAEKDRAKLTESYVKRAGSIYAGRIAPYHGDILIDEITSADCEDLLLGEWKRSGRKNKTLNNWRSVYSTIMAEAERLKVIDRSPWESVPQLSVSSNPRGGMSVAEGAALLDNPPTGEPHETYYLAMRTALLTGLRLSEVAGLVGTDIKERTTKDGTIYYIDCTRQWSAELKRRVPVKDKDARAVPIFHRLYEALKPRISGEKFIFSLRPDSAVPITINRLEDWFNSRVEAIGIDRVGRNITFHSTRRFFNTLLRRRVSGDVLRKMTGHDGEEMTEHYTDYLPEDLAAITEAQKSIAQGG
jgi:integrase